MSRARPFIDPITGQEIWFDQRAKATAAQLELLADLEGVELDDLLDEGLSQRQVLLRLRLSVDENVVPAEVLERRRERAQAALHEPECRICSFHGWECEGRITRHHYVPRWMMLTLENYQAYAARSKCTIPICVVRHRDLHLRGDSDTPKSIVPLLNERERKFAQKMLQEFRKQHPAIWTLVQGGTEHAYEYQLVRDFNLGEFRKAEGAYASQHQLEAAVCEG